MTDNSEIQPSQKQNPIFKLSRKDVEKWKELSNTNSEIEVDQETNRFLKGIFGDFLDLFSNQDAKTGNEKHRHLVNNFLKLVLDRGLNREINLFGETLSPILMVGRMGGISWLKEKIQLKVENVNGNVHYQVNDNFNILRLDVSNVFSANQVENGKGGDYLLNKVAQAINKAIDNLRSQQQDVEILPTRFGGDEFVIFVKGQLNDKPIKEIKTEITDQEAFFGSNAEKRKISLKGDKIEIINPQQISDPLKRQLFYSFLDRGVILSLDELEIEYQRISQRGGGIKSYINEASARGIYPKEVEELKDKKEKIQRKIKYLLEVHPEFKVPFYLAWYLDQKDSSSFTRQQKMLEVLENYLVDPLLDRIVITRFDLENHLQRDEIKRMLIFELKLKEINEDKVLGYGYSDLLIVKMWRQMREVLGDQLINKAKIMRFGGMIGLFFSEQANITVEQIEKFKNLQILLDEFTHDTGFLDIQFNGNEFNKLFDGQKQQILQKIFIQPDLDWLRKRVQFVLNDNVFGLFMNKLRERNCQISEEELEEKNKRKQLELFLSYLLNEKRGQIRRENLKRVLEDLKNIEEAEKINEILNNLI